jgi:phosphate transport system ATP-binding protein
MTTATLPADKRIVELSPTPTLPDPLKAEIKDFSFTYANGFTALKHINCPIAANKVTALIGPSGCGKSTLLRSLNRMHDLYAKNKYEGEITLHPDGINLVGPELDPIEIRYRVSMVFQKPNPFPKSIFENVAFGMRVRGEKNGGVIQDRVEKALRGAALWDEVKDRLDDSGMGLSGGQQQRLCIARALATDPEILLFDEPTAALDPISTAKVEQLVVELKETVTILIVTHNMQQAARCADYTAFMYLGNLVELDVTNQLFTTPGNRLTEQYLTGRFG